MCIRDSHNRGIPLPYMDKMATTIIAVINLKSVAGNPILNAIAVIALYSIEPNNTIVVVRTKGILLNIISPIIIEARPITITPVPIPTSEKPWYWAIIDPDIATSPLDKASPKNFTLPTSSPKELTNTGLSPIALSRKPNFVFRKRSNIIFITNTNIPSAVSYTHLPYSGISCQTPYFSVFCFLPLIEGLFFPL